MHDINEFLNVLTWKNLLLVTSPRRIITQLNSNKIVEVLLANRANERE